MQAHTWYLSFLSLFISLNFHAVFSMHRECQLKRLKEKTTQYDKSLDNIFKRQRQEALVFVQLAQQNPNSSNQEIAKLIVANQKTIQYSSGQSFKCEMTQHHE